MTFEELLETIKRMFKTTNRKWQESNRKTHNGTGNATDARNINVIVTVTFQVC